MTTTERLILENQKLIMHGLRFQIRTLHKGGLFDSAGAMVETLSDQMERTQDYLNAAPKNDKGVG